MIKELQDTNSILENKLKSSFIPKILAESSENINSSLNHSEVTLSENQINADSNNSSESSNESYEKTETSNSMLGWGQNPKMRKFPDHWVRVLGPMDPEPRNWLIRDLLVSHWFMTN